LEREIIRKTFDPETRETAYDKADLKDKVLMLLGEKSNQTRKKYLQKDYDMDRKLGNLKRFFGKTFKINNFERELEEYKKEYEASREEYKNAMIKLDSVGDREEAEILAYDFQISEQLRWRSDRLDIAMENNPIYENFKKFLVGAVNKYREMRKWPGDKISELFGFKGLSKGIGIVSGMLITGKALKEIGMVGNPAYKVFSVAVGAVGAKQMLEVLAEKKRIKKNEKKIKEAVNKFGADFEAGKNIDVFSEWLSEKNKSLDKEIQNEKYWRNWRTIMSVGVALGAVVGGDFLSGHNETVEDVSVKVSDHPANINNVSRVVSADNANVHTGVNTNLLKQNAEKVFGNQRIEMSEEVAKTPNIDKMIKQPEIAEPIEALEFNNSAETPEAPEMSDDDHEVIHIKADEKAGESVIQSSSPANNNENYVEKREGMSDGKMRDISNPNIEQHRNITGSEMQIAHGLGFSPEVYAKMNDLPIKEMGGNKMQSFFRKVAEMSNIDFNPSETTVKEFLRQVDIDKLSEGIKFTGMESDEYVEYFAKVINNEAVDLKRMLSNGDIGRWNQMKNHLVISELNENFGKFYEEVSGKFSLSARPNESVDNWLTRVTKFAYERGLLSEVKKELAEVVSGNAK